MSNNDLNFDFFIAADVFVYLGELASIFCHLKSQKKPASKLIFSTEHSDTGLYKLEKSGRYTHSKEYIETLCRTFDLKLTHFELQNIRKNKDHFILGGLYLLEL